MKQGIDLSENNNQDIYSDDFWETLKNSNWKDFIILRLGYGVSPERDESFLYAYQKAYDIGIRDISAYWFCYSMDAEDAKVEANNAINMINRLGVGVSRIWADIEDNSKWQKYNFDYSFSNINGIAKAWCDVFNDYGYNTGIYANLGFFENYIDYESLNQPVWLAHYSSSPGMDNLIWQAGEDLYLDGYGPFDYNYK